MKRRLGGNSHDDDRSPIDALNDSAGLRFVEEGFCVVRSNRWFGSLVRRLSRETLRHNCVAAAEAQIKSPRMRQSLV